MNYTGDQLLVLWPGGFGKVVCLLKHPGQIGSKANTFIAALITPHNGRTVDIENVGYWSKELSVDLY